MIDKYIKMRNSGQYQMNWFYDYYIQNGGDLMVFNKFSMAFNMGDLNQTLESLDKKFNLMSILDAKGQTLKVLKNE
jgi:hypothetical protein